MPVLVPWPAPTAKRSSTTGVFTTAEVLHSLVPVAADIPQVLSEIQRDLANLKPLKEEVRKDLELALASSNVETLRGACLEFVGSASWGGDVPNSDLDFVLMTSSRTTSGRQAVDALRDLGQSMQNLSWSLPCNRWHRLELLDTAYVPILRLHCQAGFHCDVSVDQHRSIAHRDLLLQAAKDRPKVRSLVKLIKVWLRRRGLPTSAEGGLPSLAWTLIAVRIAMERPKDTRVDVLFYDFFAMMQRLTDHALFLRQPPAQSVNTGAATQQFFDWIPRGGSASAWAHEWVQFISVEDPCASMATGSARKAVTPPSIPAALALAYVTDLRLGWREMREGRWYDFWRCQQTPRSLSSLSADRQLHVVIKDGLLRVGQIRDTRSCKASNPGDTLHHRDQSSQLFFQTSEIKIGHAFTVFARKAPTEAVLECHPCHFVGSLQVGPRKALLGGALYRLAELTQIVGSTHVDHELARTVMACAHAHARFAIEVQNCPLLAAPEFHNSTRMLAEHAGEQLQAVELSDDSYGHCWDVARREGTHAPRDASDESTRASDSDCESDAMLAPQHTSQEDDKACQSGSSSETCSASDEPGSLDDLRDSTEEDSSSSDPYGSSCATRFTDEEPCALDGLPDATERYDERSQDEDHTEHWNKLFVDYLPFADEPCALGSFDADTERHTEQSEDENHIEYWTKLFEDYLPFADGPCDPDVPDERMEQEDGQSEDENRTEHWAKLFEDYLPFADEPCALHSPDEDMEAENEQYPYDKDGDSDSEVAGEADSQDIGCKCLSKMPDEDTDASLIDLAPVALNFDTAVINTPALTAAMRTQSRSSAALWKPTLRHTRESMGNTSADANAIMSASSATYVEAKTVTKKPTVRSAAVRASHATRKAKLIWRPKLQLQSNDILADSSTGAEDAPTGDPMSCEDGSTSLQSASRMQCEASRSSAPCRSFADVVRGFQNSCS